MLAYRAPMSSRALTASLSSLAVGTLAAALLVASAAPASAHAIVALNGDPAYAGRTSTMTLEIQHGCLQNEAGIEKIAAYFDKAYGKVVPGKVDDWTASVKRTGKTTKVVWTLTGDVPGFNTPVFFPMAITWPKKPGVYGLPVRQWCDGATNIWDEPDGPATAGQPSPPLFPLPQIKVLSAPR